jgi:uncharacterized protein (TIGR03086 family)
MRSDPVDLLARALGQTQALIAEVRPHHTALPTPCRSWDVATLLDHMLGDLPAFVVAAEGGQPDYAAAPASVSPDWAAAFKQRSEELLQVWRDARDPDKLADGEGPREFQSMQVAEMAVHGWDLKKAIGSTAELDAEVAEYSVQWMGGMLVPEYRGSEAEGKAFGPLVEVGPDAAAYDRLVATSGRDPAWTSPTS